MFVKKLIFTRLIKNYSVLVRLFVDTIHGTNMGSDKFHLLYDFEEKSLNIYGTLR